MAESNNAPQNNVPQVELRSATIDIAHVVVVTGVLLLYGISLYNGNTAPPELATALSVLVGSIVGRSLPK